MKRLFKKIIVTILTVEARILLSRKRPKIIAVTGSVGKTTTKDAIYAAIKNNQRARKSEKSFNSDIGVPLTILGLPNAWNSPLGWVRNVLDGLFIACTTREYPTVLVLEAGIDAPGDMGRLTAWLKPDIVVLTRLPDVPVHVEYFKTPADVITEKMKLVEALRPDGVVVYNHDDAIIQAQLPSIRQQVIGYSRDVPSVVTASKDKTVYHTGMPVATKFMIHTTEGEGEIEIVGTIGTQLMYSYTAAVAVAQVLGISLVDAIMGLSEATPPPGRMKLIPGLKGTVLIDDTYNSSPIAAEQAIAALRELRAPGRKIAVLGDMLELGKYSNNEHVRIGELVGEVVDVLYTVGIRAQKIAYGALAAQLPESAIVQFEDAESAGKALQALLQSGDIVLIKGSQGIRLERVVEEVMAEPERAETLLVRQDTEWKRRV